LDRSAEDLNTGAVMGEAEDAPLDNDDESDLGPTRNRKGDKCPGCTCFAAECLMPAEGGAEWRCWICAHFIAEHDAPDRDTWLSFPHGSAGAALRGECGCDELDIFPPESDTGARLRRERAAAECGAHETRSKRTAYVSRLVSGAKEVRKHSNPYPSTLPKYEG